MSTGGQAVGGVLGAVAGFFLAGPGGALKGAMYGAQIGMTIGGYLDPPKGPTITGPRLDDLTVQTSTYGAIIPRSYGTASVVGNLFWLENNHIKETVKKKKSSSGGKGGGPKTTTITTSYSATFAVGFSRGEIASYRRIWASGNLIYDAGASDAATVIASSEGGGQITMYLGSDTQLPDDRMQATLGVANTPAYRGLAYLVFKDFQLEKYGNNLMGVQIKAEVVKDGTETGLRTINQITVMPNGTAYRKGAFGWDTLPIPILLASGDGTLRVGTLSDSKVKTFDLAGYVIDTDNRAETENFPDTSLGQPLGILNGDQVWARNLPSAIGSASIIPVGNTDGYDITSVLPSGEFVGGIALTYNGSHILVLTSPTSESYATKWYLMTFNGSATIIRNGTIEEPIYYTTFGYGSTSRTTSACMLDSDLKTSWSYQGAGAHLRHYTIDDDDVLRTGAMFDIATGDSFAYPTIYVKNGIISIIACQMLVILTANPSVTPNLVMLSSIVSSEALLSNLLGAGDIDVTGLTQTVRGYKIASIAAIRSALEPLQAAWPFDVVQAGYKIKFVMRGSASVATIPASDLDARGAGEAPGISITNSREMDSVLPRRVTLNYLDADREYDAGSQSDERLNTEAVNVLTLDLAIVLNASEALGIVQTLLYLYWLERYDLTFSLPPTYNHLEPGDTITVNATEAAYTLRLTAITYTQDGRLECTAKYNSSAIYVRTALGESGQSTGKTLSLAGGASFVLLDIPLLTDAMDTPGFAVAVAGYLPGWPGGELYRSDDAGQTWFDVQGFQSPGAMIGTAATALSAPATTALLDKAGQLTASFVTGTLASVTELALLNGANHFAYGQPGRWEIIGAQTCTLQIDGSYILSDFLRGQRGTEWACGLHVSGDRIIELDSGTIDFITASVDSIGLEKTWRIVTAGKEFDTGYNVTATYAGVNLECLAPCYLNGSRHPSSNDWALTWIRRTRIGGAWRDLVNASLGETTESYEVEIYSDGTYTTRKNTLIGLSTAAATYASAQQVADFGSNQATLWLKIYQLSSVVGRGYPLTTSITR